MDHHAVQQAASRIARAEKALADLDAATNFDDAEAAWTDFLLAASTIYSKLEQGAKGAGKSEAWFGRQKKQRKDNPILRYLHFARNSDEHGIERVVHRQDDSRFFPEPQPFGKRTKFEDCKWVDPATGAELGEPFTAWAYGPHLSCIPAHDRRFGDSCEPPSGEDVGGHGHDPVDIAKAALPLLRKMVEESAELV